MKIERFDRPHAGGGASSTREPGQQVPGLHPPLLRHRRPPKDPIESLIDRAQRKDPEAWATIRTLIERREYGDRALDTFLQVCLATLTLAGLYLFGDVDRSIQLFGACICLAAQPFWLIDAWRSRKFGIFIVALAFAVLWVRAIYVRW